MDTGPQAITPPAPHAAGISNMDRQTGPVFQRLASIPSLERPILGGPLYRVGAYSDSSMTLSTQRVMHDENAAFMNTGGLRERKFAIDRIRIEGNRLIATGAAEGVPGAGPAWGSTVPLSAIQAGGRRWRLTPEARGNDPILLVKRVEHLADGRVRLHGEEIGPRGTRRISTAPVEAIETPRTRYELLDRKASSALLGRVSRVDPRARAAALRSRPGPAGALGPGERSRTAGPELAGQNASPAARSGQRSGGGGLTAPGEDRWTPREMLEMLEEAFRGSAQIHRAVGDKANQSEALGAAVAIRAALANPSADDRRLSMAVQRFGEVLERHAGSMERHVGEGEVTREAGSIARSARTHTLPRSLPRPQVRQVTRHAGRAA